MMKRWKYPY